MKVVQETSEVDEYGDYYDEEEEELTEQEIMRHQRQTVVTVDPMVELSNKLSQALKQVRVF